MDIKNIFHQKIIENNNNIKNWYASECKKLSLPIYSSFDIRDAGFKAAIVDANIFPAGFNNICQVDKENAETLMLNYFEKKYQEDNFTKYKKIVLITEEHTNNAFYWENVNSLVKILEGAEKEVRVAFPKEMEVPFLKITSSGGSEITVYSAKRHESGLIVGEDFKPDLIISNNDFSEAYEDWAEGLKTPINPSRELGWYQRKKSSYFTEYNNLLVEFCQLIDMDPWLLQVQTKNFLDFDLSNEEQKENLANSVQKILDQTKVKYNEYGIKDEPFVMLKNNSGTYGLAVLQIRSAEDVLKLNNKSRKKMKAAKGGRAVDEVIIQEGIPSSLISDPDNDGGAEVAEPAIYMIGGELAGGFLRTHNKKGPQESLNSPGAIYKRLCVSDLKIDIEGHPLENSYGYLAKLGLLAIGRESAAMNVSTSY